MTSSPKPKFNIYYLLVGTLFVILFAVAKRDPVTESDLTTKTVTLKKKPIYLNGRGASGGSYLRIWTNETKAAFKIEVPGAIAAGWASLDSLKRDDSITVKYWQSEKNELDNESAEIPVYHLQKGARLYFNSTAYNRAEKSYLARVKWYTLVTGLLLLLGGLAIVPENTFYVLGGIVAAVIIILRIIGIT